MGNIQLTARMKIHDGKAKLFKELAVQCMLIVKEKEKANTLQYDWFNNEDETEFVIRETYANSDAVLAHMGNVGELLGKMSAISDLSVEFYGDLSSDLRLAIAPFNAKVYSLFQGL
ncbi:MAG: antibiotic biosynthesis monooxygenase [Eudoraea sp.]|uniref:putative quinol monooxygenase n=2 Tax=Eudoraea sp. TaxID=1979955 RepID=UPI003C758D51